MTFYRPPEEQTLDISSDELRRQVKQSQAEHNQAMKALRNAMGRLFDRDDADGEAIADHFVGNLHRRRFLQVGGLTLLTGAALAACGKSSSSSTAAGSTGAAASGGSRNSTTTASGGIQPDAGIFRLASSLEHYAVGLYGTAASSGLVKTAAIGDAAKYFASQHADHANADEQLTSKAGGMPFTTANQAVADMLKPRVDALKSEADVVKLAYDVESVAAATYFSTIGAFKDTTGNAAAASILAVEARHVAVLGMLLSGLPAPLPTIPARTDSSPYAAAGFQTKDGAVALGTGV
jgi:Ferritin-like domain